MHIFQSVSGHSREQSITRYSSQTPYGCDTVGQLYRSHKVSAAIYQSDLRISNHRGHKFPPLLTLLSFKAQIEWPPVLIPAANFLSLLFQLLQYSRECPSYSVHMAALMTKAVSIFPASSSRFVDFTVQFCFRCKFSFHKEQRSSQVWQWCDFLLPIKIFCYAEQPMRLLHLYRQ